MSDSEDILDGCGNEGKVWAPLRYNIGIISAPLRCNIGMISMWKNFAPISEEIFCIVCIR